MQREVKNSLNGDQYIKDIYPLRIKLDRWLALRELHFSMKLLHVSVIVKDVLF